MLSFNCFYLISVARDPIVEDMSEHVTSSLHVKVCSLLRKVIIMHLV